MAARKGTGAVVVVLLGCLAGLRAAGQDVEDMGNDPWVMGLRDDPFMEAEDWEQDMRAFPPGWGEGPGGRVLRRCEMNGLESAHYSTAELLLQFGDARAAVVALQAALERTRSPVLRDLTHYNLATIHRYRLGDTEAASKHYMQVRGSLRESAKKAMLRMLARKGKGDAAAEGVEQLLEQAEQEGERLALLHQLAREYQRQGLPRQALAVYQRITREFTPDDIRQMVESAEREAEDAVKKIRQLEEGDQYRQAERLRRRLERRGRELRQAGRWDECRAYERALARRWDEEPDLELPPEPVIEEPLENPEPIGDRERDAADHGRPGATRIRRRGR